MHGGYPPNRASRPVIRCLSPSRGLPRGLFRDGVKRRRHGVDDPGSGRRDPMPVGEPVRIVIGQPHLADCTGWSDLFSDADLLTKSGKEQLEAVESKWFYEIAECDGMDKVAVTKIKAFITRQFDRARKAYGRNRSEVPRTCIFVGTSNEKELFRDPTGERRFWPVGVTKYDRKAFLEHRDQIFAEAVVREPHEKLWLDDADLRAEHAKKIDSLRARDGIEDLVAYVTGPVGNDGEERVSSAQVFMNLQLGARDLTDKTTKRVAVAMRRCGWMGPQSVRIASDDGKTFVASGYKRSKEAREAFRASLVSEGDSPHMAAAGPTPDPGAAAGQTAEDVGEASCDNVPIDQILDLLRANPDFLRSKMGVGG
jgi:hypothetical protein